MRNLHKSICMVLSILAVIFSGMMVDAAEEKVDVLIVTGFDVGSHKWEDSTKLVQAILVKTGRFDVTVSKDLRQNTSHLDLATHSRRDSRCVCRRCINLYNM